MDNCSIMVVKRRDKILQVSLVLFNNEGEANLTAVDIANELDMSPGNLYYHFKGKEDIITALFGQYESIVLTLLADARNTGSHNNSDALEEHWLHLYVLLEHLYHYRFLFRNSSDLIAKYTAIEVRFRRLLDQQYQSVLVMLSLLFAEKHSVSGLREPPIEALADQIMLIYTQWFEFKHLRQQGLDKHSFIQEAIFQIMTLLMPYMGDQQLQFTTECQRLFQIAKPTE